MSELPLRICIECKREFHSPERRRECNPCRNRRYATQAPCSCGSLKDRKAGRCRACVNWRPDPAPISARDTAWLAGILEGEGTFVRHNKTQARVRVQMTDEDVVRHLHEITGVGSVTHVTAKYEGHKESWAWTVGTVDHVTWLVSLTAPLLGERRRIAAQTLWGICGLPSASFPCEVEPEATEADAWMAGYLEGEGTFSLRRGKPRAIEASSVDRDILLRVQRVAGCGRIYEIAPRKPTHSPASKWMAYRVGEVRDLAIRLEPYLCSRRKRQIQVFI